MSDARRPSRTEIKAAQTDSLARKIIKADAKKQDEKTARLRAERLRRDAAEAPGEVQSGGGTAKGLAGR